MNICEHIATKGLKRMIEGNYGLPVELIPPTGVDITENEDGETLKSQVLYDREGVDMETGGMIVIGGTTVTLRKSALSRVPVAGEIWGIRIPINPADPDTLSVFLINTDEAPTDGQSAGFIILKLKEAEEA